MPIVCGVKFRGTSKIYYFSPGDVQDLQVNDQVIVETSRGMEMGQVVIPPREVDPSEIVAELKPIIRRATPADLLDAQNFRQQEPEALSKCKELVAKLKLPMKVVGAEYNYDGSRLTFFFTAEQRVDFRELVRELAHVFRTRIEMRQIGVRDEAKLLGGIGKCGRLLCCATWLTEFCPVSIRMAKQQDLPLSPMEISGLCGRLLCCLEYENDYYQEVKGRFPKVGKTIETPLGPGKVVKVSVLKETVSVLLEDGSTVELTADQVAGKSAIEPRPKSSLLGERQKRALDVTMPKVIGQASPLNQESHEKSPLGEERQHSAAQAKQQPGQLREDEPSSVKVASFPQDKLEGDGQDSGHVSQPKRSRKRKRARKARSSPVQEQSSAATSPRGDQRQERDLDTPSPDKPKDSRSRRRRRKSSDKESRASQKGERQDKPLTGAQR